MAADYSLLFEIVRRLSVELRNRSFHYARGVWLRRRFTAQRPPGLALLISVYLSGSLELAVVPGVGGAPDQRPANDAWPCHCRALHSTFCRLRRSPAKEDRAMNSARCPLSRHFVRAHSSALA